MSKDTLYLGKCGEEAAVNFLKDSGFRIYERNYRTRFGEIDIIAGDKDTVCFIEVKTRASGKAGLPAEAVTAFKQRRISRAALVFLKEKNLLERKARFDVVSIVYSEGSLKVDLIRNAFELDSSFTY